MLPRPMKRAGVRRTVADRLLQNINGIRFELEQMKKTLAESGTLFEGSDHVLIERTLEKLESESEKLAAVLEVKDDDNADPLHLAG